MSKLKLNDDVAAKYKLLYVQVGTYDFPGFGLIDLHLLSLSEADQLVARGFPFLEARQEPRSKKGQAAE